ncbi:LicD family protein [Vreelandella profundi]|uniref:LicD family protein n=1 Tax=Vreelandella profundi TaxID=2852117 RepID=UPI001EF14FE7|nr:LicD family protein [Halomonas profundi]
MNPVVYRKLKKLITKPRLYFEDAKLNKQSFNFKKISEELIKAEMFFEKGEIDKAKALAENIPRSSQLGALFLAKIALFEKQYAQSEQDAFQVMQLLSPYSAEFKKAFYLHQEALRWQHQYDSALTMIENMPFKDNASRYYRALRLACLGANAPAKFERQLIRLTSNHKEWLRARNHYIMLLRDLGKEQRALIEANRLVQEILRQPKGKPKSPCQRTESQKVQWQAKAATALLQLKQDLNKHDIEFFLVSGTLLGCVREGRILGHDTDIDVGVLPQTSMKQLRQALSESSRFKFLEVFSENTLYVEHANGVHVDIFRHYEQDGKLYHGGIKCQWWNSPFTLLPQVFLGEQYLVPEDTNKYLTENYGDWQTPVTDFATFLDTPNMEINNPANMALYYATQIITAYRQSEVEKYQRYQCFFKALMTKLTKNIRLDTSEK